MSDHAKLSPSAAIRWMTCPGSVKLTAGLPDVESDAAAEGTKAHLLAEQCLTQGVSPKELEGDYTDEMRSHIAEYLDFVERVSGDGRKFIEQRLDLREYITDGFGTADVVVFNAPDLHIIDLKYGMRKVDVHENPQLMIYGLGALSKVRDKVQKIHLHIAQPRLNHYDTWVIDKPVLEEFGFKVAAAADLCATDDAPLNPSEKACEWCKASTTCPALYAHTLKVVGDRFDPIPAEDLTDEQLRLVLDNKTLIEKWLKSVENYAYNKSSSGEGFPGYKLVEGRSVRKYTQDAETTLVKILGDDAFERKLITVTAAEKILGKKHFKELGITDKPPGKPVLVPDTDKRVAIGGMDDFESLN